MKRSARTIATRIFQELFIRVALLLAVLILGLAFAHADTQRAIAAFDRKDYNTAWREFMVSAQEGDAEAQAGVGAMLFAKINPVNTGFYADCEKWLTASARQGNAKGMTYLGLFYFNDGKRLAGGNHAGINTSPVPAAYQQAADRRFVQARQWLEQASALGDGYAMGNLAILLDAGLGGPRDPQRAAQLRAGVGKRTDANFTNRATANPAYLSMSASWQAGHYNEALQSAQALADKGDATGQAMLGRAYYEGTGVAQNYSYALYYLTRAAAQNNADSIFFLGLMYEHARGVHEDLNRALSLFDRAAKLGQRYAQMEAAGMRMQGESNRIAAMIRANGGTEDGACATAGGIATPGACIKGGEHIDPYNPYSY